MTLYSSEIEFPSTSFTQAKTPIHPFYISGYTCTHTYAEGRTTFVILRPKQPSSSYSFVTGSGDGARLCLSLAYSDGARLNTSTAAASSGVVLTKLNHNCQPYNSEEFSSVESAATRAPTPQRRRRRRETEMELSFAGKLYYRTRCVRYGRAYVLASLMACRM